MEWRRSADFARIATTSTMPSGNGDHPPRALVMALLLPLPAALVVAGVVLAIVVVKWLFILAVVAALGWVTLFFVRRIARAAVAFAVNKSPA
ncbi:MAG: hypothetical protein ACJ77E_02885 [Gaiellaceae bacterium]